MNMRTAIVFIISTLVILGITISTYKMFSTTTTQTTTITITTTEVKPFPLLNIPHFRLSHESDNTTTETYPTVSLRGDPQPDLKKNWEITPPVRQCSPINNNNTTPRILVIYVYYNNIKRPEEVQNFQFFINHAIVKFYERDAGIVDYYLVVNNREHPGIEFPPLCNVWVVKKDNSLDMCSYYQVLMSGIVDMTRYRYFFFMNAVTIGPFLPNYWLDSWWLTFVNLMNSRRNVKLVGPYANCELTPHLQTPVFATDARGLSIISSLWGCADHDTTVYKMEVSQSGLLREYGYDFASMMHLYQSVNITSNCNWKKNPYLFGVVDEKVQMKYFVHPFETVFVRRGAVHKNFAGLYSSYVDEAEHRRLVCPECWKNPRCTKLCPPLQI